MNKNKLVFRPSRRAIALEPRLLFDGAGAIAAADAAETETAQPPVPAATQQDNSSTPASTTEVLDNATGAGDLAPDLPANINTADESNTADEDRQDTRAGDDNPDDDTDPATIDGGDAASTLVVVDARVADMDGFTLDLPANVTVRVVARDESGLDAVGQVLADSGQRYDTIHIISHGTPGSLTLGNETIAGGRLSDAQREKLLAWVPSLTDEADILLYGCDIAAGNEGEAFITELAHLTGADIAASTDATGAADKGGDWDLERSTGAIEATTLSVAGFNSLLAAPSIHGAPTQTITVIEPSTLNDGPEDSQYALTGWTIDSGATGNITLEVTLDSTANGLLLAPAETGVTAIANGWRFTGNASAAQTWLNQVVFQAADIELGNTAATVEMTVAVTNSEALTSTRTVSLTITPSNDPVVVPDSTMTVSEGSSTVITAATLAALDPEVTAGTQNATQIVYRVEGLPSHGYIEVQGVRLGEGSIFTHQDVLDGQVKYVHTSTGADQNASDGFRLSVNDGATPQAQSDLVDITVHITPVNQPPVVSGSGVIFEGQPANDPNSVVGNFIVAHGGGDPGDDASQLVVRIDSLPTDGTLYFDGVEITQADIDDGFTFTYDQRDKLTYANHGLRDNNGIGPYGHMDGFDVTVTDVGGGTGTPASASARIDLNIRPVNDDPVLDEASDLAAEVPAVGSYIVTLTPADLSSTDVDSPASHITYVITKAPEHGYVLLNGQGLPQGGSFTQADLEAGRVRYVQRDGGIDQTQDTFHFTVVDNTVGPVWNPDGSHIDRIGGIYDDAGIPGNPADDALRNHVFTLNLAPVTEGNGDDWDLLDIGTTENSSTYAGVNSAGVAHGSLPEGGSITLAGTGFDPTNTPGLSYTVTTGPDPDDVVPPDQVVYTITGFGGVSGDGWNGTLTRNGVALNLYDTFTQDDLDNGRISFQHDGGEDFHSWVNLSASAGVLVRSVPGDENSPLVQDQWHTDFHFYITPVNDAPEVSGSDDLVIPEGETAYITTGSLGISDADDHDSAAGGANGEPWAEGSAQLHGDDNYAVNHDAANPLTYVITNVPTSGGELQWYNSATSEWEAVVDGVTTLDAAAITGSADTTGLRFVHDGSEVRSASFQVKAIDRWGAESQTTATVTIQITNVNDGPQIAADPQQADPPLTGPGDPNNVGPAEQGSANNPLTGVPEGGFKQITTAELQAYDPDSSAEQVQYRITRAPSHGRLAYSTDGGLTFQTISVGAAFTQADVAAGRIYYLHNGDEVKGNTYVEGTGAGASVLADTDDHFVFTLADGDKEQPGNQFWIFAEPTNDAPTVTAPGGPIHIDSQIPANNPVSGFSVADPDLTDDVTAPYETDFVQVTVRLLDQAGNPIANYTTGFGGGGVQIGHAMPADVGGLWMVQGGNNSILQFQGTREQVNQALAGLTVTFENDLNQRFRVEVIADDRLRDASGNLVTTGSDANGGEMNQATTPGGAPTAVDGTQPDWANGDAVPSGSHVLAGNISAASVEIWASHTNEAATFTGPTSVTVNEDVRTQINGFVVRDPESDGLGTPVTVTISVPNTAVHGTLSVGSTTAQTSLTPAGGQAVTITGDNTRTITLTGRAQDIQALLNGRNVDDTADDANGGLFYRSGTHVNHDLNDDDAGDVTLILSFNDTGSAIGSDTGDDSQPNNPADITTAITITAVNDAPSVNPGDDTSTITIGGTGFVAVPGFKITDVDAKDGYAAGEADDVIEVTVRVLGDSNTPLSAAQYESLGISLSSTYTGSEVNVDTTYTGAHAALQVRGTLAKINDYLAGLQVQFANADTANVDATYRIDVIADDRLRNLDGSLAGGANGGALNQNEDNDDLGAIPTGEIDPYDVAYASGGAAVGGLYNLRSNSREVFISTVNDPGQITGGDVTVNEGASNTTHGTANTVTLDAISVDDPDHNGESVTVTVSVPDGFTINSVGVGGGSVTSVGGTSVTITGTQDQINQRLNGIVVGLPDPDGAGAAERADWHGSFEVTVVYEDNGNTGLRPIDLEGDEDNDLDKDAARDPDGTGDYQYVDSTSNKLRTTRIFTVTVNPVNDAPVVTSTADVMLPAVLEDSDAAGIAGETVGNLFGSRYSDPRDAGTDNSTGSNPPDTFYGVAVVGVSTDAAQGEWQYSLNGTDWLPVGDRADGNALVLEATARLRFVPAADFHGEPEKLTVRLVETDANGDSGMTQPTNGQTVNVSGTGLGGVGGATIYSEDTIDLVTSVTNVNDAPEAVDGEVGTVEDLLSVASLDATSGWSVTDLAAVLGYDDTTDNQTGVTGGGNAEQPAVQGLAIVGDVLTPDGTWYYYDGTVWTAVPSGASETGALVLRPTDRLAFVPNADYNGTPTATLDVRLTDAAPAAVGEGVVLSAEIGAPDSHWSEKVDLTVKVAPRNDAPAFSHDPSNPTVTENGSTGSGTSIDPVNLLGSGSVTDIDLGTTPGLDSDVFGAGSVTADLTDGIAGDVLQLGGGLAAGANGILSVTGGAYDVVADEFTPLVITFTSAATRAEVQAVLAAIQYTHTSDDPTSLLSGTPDTQRSYTITLSDGNNVDPDGDHAGGPDPLTVTKNGTITIHATNDPPEATDNSETISEGTATPVGGNVITDNDGHGVDSDPDTPVTDLRITNITPPPGGSGGGSVSGPTTVEGLYGTLTIQPDGSYTYTLNNDHPAVKGLNDPTDTLTEVFGYTLSDGSLTDTANLTITITGVDDPVTVTVPNDTSATSPDGDITDHVVFESALPDGSDPDTTPGANTTVSSSFTVVAEDDLDPDDAIVVDYTRADGSPATLTLTKAQVEALATTQQTITTRYGELVLNGYSVGTDGTVTIGYTYTLTTAPAVDGADTMDSFRITANDRDDDSDSQTLNIKIVDDAPAAVSDTNSLLRHEGTVGGNVYDNDQDTIGADGPAASGPVTGVRAGNDTGTPATEDVGGLGVTGKYGNVVIYADGSYTYTIDPANAEVIALGTGELTDEFVYTITDADGDTATATLTITITANQPPEVEPESVTTPEDKPITGNLLTNDSDPDGDPLTVTEFVVDIGGTPTTFTVPPGESTAAVIPGVGTITIGSDGSYEYVPEPDWHGTVPQVTYTVSDGTGDPVNGTRQSTLDITVTPVVDIETDTSSTLVNTPVTIPVLDNDSFEGDSPEVTGTTPPANGSVTVNLDGTITYTPNPGFTGTDTFTYTVTSGGVTETATVTVEVYNDTPAPQPDRVVTREDTPARGNVLANDGEPDGHPLTVTEFTVNGRTYTAGSTVNIPGAGSFTLRPDGSYTFVPVPDWHGNVPTITYTVTDGTGAVNHSASSELRITVTPVPDIEPDKTSTEEGKPVTIPVLDNDSFEGKPRITGTTPPANGTVTINPDGTITYTPDPGFTGTDTFTYTVTSGGVTETATVTVQVLPGKAQGLVGLPPDRLNGASGPSAFPHGPVSGRHVPDAWISGLPRAGLGVDPVTYVHEAVVAAQTEREFVNDSQAIGRIDMARPYNSGVQVPGMDLGFDPTLFVQHAVRSSQSLAEFMQQLVQGRHGRASLSADHDLPTPGLYQPDAARLAPQPDDSAKEAAKPAPDAGTPDKAASLTSADADLLADETAADDAVGHEAVRSAPSFAEQLRRGATRLPMSVARI